MFYGEGEQRMERGQETNHTDVQKHSGLSRRDSGFKGPKGECV